MPSHRFDLYLFLAGLTIVGIRIASPGMAAQEAITFCRNADETSPLNRNNADRTNVMNSPPATYSDDATARVGFALEGLTEIH